MECNADRFLGDNREISGQVQDINFETISNKLSFPSEVPFELDIKDKVTVNDVVLFRELLVGGHSIISYHHCVPILSRGMCKVASTDNVSSSIMSFQKWSPFLLSI